MNHPTGLSSHITDPGQNQISQWLGSLKVAVIFTKFRETQKNCQLLQNCFDIRILCTSVLYWLLIHVCLCVWNVSEGLYRKLPCGEQKLFIKMLLRQKTSLLVEYFLRWLFCLSRAQAPVCPCITLELFLRWGLPGCFTCALHCLSSGQQQCSASCTADCPKYPPIQIASAPRQVCCQLSQTPLLAHDKQGQQSEGRETQSCLSRFTKPHAGHKWLE